MFLKLKRKIQTFNELYHGYLRRLVWLSLLGIFGGLLEGLGIGALLPLFSFITGGEGINPDLVSRFIHRFFDLINLPFSLISLLLFIPTLFVLKALVLLVFSYFKVLMSAEYESDYRTRLYQAVLQANWPSLQKQKLGHVENTLMVNIYYTVLLLDQVAELIRMLATFAVYLIVALLISWQITLIAMLIGIVTLFFSRPILKKTQLYARYKANLNKLVAHYVNEQMLGLKTIKSFNLLKPLIKKAANFFEEIRRVRIKQTLVKSLTKVSIEPVIIILVVIVFAFSYSRSDFNLAAFAAIMYLVERIFLQVGKTQKFVHDALEAVAYTSNVLALSKTMLAAREADPGIAPFVFEKGLEFRSVSFTYPDTHEVSTNGEVLTGFNFKIKPGEVIAIVGPSGSGKTTVVDLLLRLLEPSAGQILLDGQPISSISLKAWRQAISYVPQEPFLLNDTVENNIRFYDETISDENIWQAINQVSQEGSFASRLNGDLKTVVGERGLSLSGGERQRLVLARALARRPQILVLDEATSALDTAAEESIVEELERLHHDLTKLTIIIITHRPALAKIANWTLRLPGGEIIAKSNKSSYE